MARRKADGQPSQRRTELEKLEEAAWIYDAVYGQWMNHSEAMRAFEAEFGRSISRNTFKDRLAEAVKLTQDNMGARLNEIVAQHLHVYEHMLQQAMKDYRSTLETDDDGNEDKWSLLNRDQIEARIERKLDAIRRMLGLDAPARVEQRFIVDSTFDTEIAEQAREFANSAGVGSDVAAQAEWYANNAGSV